MLQMSLPVRYTVRYVLNIPAVRVKLLQHSRTQTYIPHICICKPNI